MMSSEECKSSAFRTALDLHKEQISTQSRDIECHKYATDPSQRHAATGRNHARSSGGPLRIDSQASTGISNVNTITSRYALAQKLTSDSSTPTSTAPAAAIGYDTNPPMIAATKPLRPMSNPAS